MQGTRWVSRKRRSTSVRHRETSFRRPFTSSYLLVPTTEAATAMGTRVVVAVEAVGAGRRKRLRGVVEEGVVEVEVEVGVVVKVGKGAAPHELRSDG